MVKPSYRLYITAGIITALVFLLGLSLGLLIDELRQAQAQDIINKQEAEFNSLYIQSLFLTSQTIKTTNQSCNVLKRALSTAVADLGEALDRFLAFKKEGRLNIDQGRYLERRYLLSNVRYWIISRDYKQLCPDADVVNVLYFFSEKQCDQCPNQGVILTYFKKRFGDRLLIFPINIDLDEPVVGLLTAAFNITTLPSIVVEDKTYRGIIGKSEFLKIICQNFRNPQIECQELYGHNNEIIQNTSKKQ